MRFRVDIPPPYLISMRTASPLASLTSTSSIIPIAVAVVIRLQTAETKVNYY